jgi:DNA-binding GntR family transcriptional regulator
VADRKLERDLQILTAIGEGAPLTQRALAKRLGVALGLTNLYLKRLGHKGLIKIGEFPTKPASVSATCSPRRASRPRPA